MSAVYTGIQSKSPVRVAQEWSRLSTSITSFVQEEELDHISFLALVEFAWIGPQLRNRVLGSKCILEYHFNTLSNILSVFKFSLQWIWYLIKATYKREALFQPSVQRSIKHGEVKAAEAGSSWSPGDQEVESNAHMLSSLSLFLQLRFPARKWASLTIGSSYPS